MLELKLDLNDPESCRKALMAINAAMGVPQSFVDKALPNSDKTVWCEIDETGKTVDVLTQEEFEDRMKQPPVNIIADAPLPKNEIIGRTVIDGKGRPVFQSPDHNMRAATKPQGIENDDTELDIDGNTWNPEIHSRGKTKTSDGRWRVKRGAELPPTKCEDISTPTIPAPPVAPQATEVPPPPVAAAALPTEIPAPPAPAAAMNFNEFISYVFDRTQAGSLDKAQVLKIVQKHGINELHELSQRAELIPVIYKQLELM